MCRRKNQIAIGLVLLLAGGIAPSHSRCEEELRGLRVEREVFAKIVDAVRKNAPEVKVSIEEDSVRMEFLCQEYSVYRGGKGGTNKELTTDRGPTDRGFMVTLGWSQEGYSGQLGGGPNQELREFYWSRHLYEFKLPKDRGFVHLDYSPGALTNPKIGADILALLEKECGLEEKSVQNRYDRTAKFLIDQLFDVLEPRLRTLIEKRHPEATVKRVGNELLVSYQVQEFVLHAVDANGSVATKSHVEIGPAKDGFLIKIGGARASVRGQSLQLHGMSSGPLWNRAWNSFAPGRSGDREFVRYGVIRMETNFVAKTHHPLFREVEDLLTEYGKPAIKGLYE